MKRLFLFFAGCMTAILLQAEITTYRNVPYAHAERFRAPVYFPYFVPTADYTERGPECMQRKRSHPQQDSTWCICGETYRCEECLVLTINTPTGYAEMAPDSLLPVVLQIHGGSFLTGSGQTSEHDLSELAERQQLVTVSINYRLGVFGFLYQPDSGSVDNGLKDQLCAIRWVYEHIAHFGGDPKNITMLGQSAGALSEVFVLSALREPMIRRAAVFSSPMGVPVTKSAARRKTRDIREKTEDIWTADADTLVNYQQAYCHKHRLDPMPWMPVETPIYPDSIRCGVEKVVMCVQQDDGSLFAPKGLRSLITALEFKQPAKRYVRYLKKQGIDAQFHLFTWAPRGSQWGAAHCAEIVLYEGHLDNWIGSGIVGDVTADELQQRRIVFMKHLGDFARTGAWNFE